MNSKQEELVLHLPGRSECRTVASLRNRPMFYYGDDLMALEFEGSANPAIVGFNWFERLADLVGIERSAIEHEVWHTVETIRRLAGHAAEPARASRLAGTYDDAWGGLTLAKKSVQ
jgi:hypothetical protein